MIDKPFSPATARNSQPILDVIRHEFRSSHSLLEIGSGTGQHAVNFAAKLTHLVWQTSDREQNHQGIMAWLDAAALSNVQPPIVLDVLSDEWPKGNYDAVFSANTAHIMCVSAVQEMFALVGRVLNTGGSFCLYGPFKQDGKCNSPSNDEFDHSLRTRDPKMSIRNLEDLDHLGSANNLLRNRLYALPANNHLAVWVKCGQENCQ
jgi:cyclopropane fatty-acyl-phospholipid synthase-like methyltransferase